MFEDMNEENIEDFDFNEDEEYLYEEENYFTSGSFNKNQTFDQFGKFIVKKDEFIDPTELEYIILPNHPIPMSWSKTIKVNFFYKKANEQLYKKRKKIQRF
jgi:uracil DNA glycosylase